MDFSNFSIDRYIDFALTYMSQYSFKIFAALAIFFVGKFFIKKIAFYFKRLMEKAHVDQTLVNFLHSVIYFILLLVVVLAALSALGINTTSFLAVFGAASLAIGLALKDSLSNIGAAIIIIVFRPFKVGDFVEAGGASGTVKEISLFSTTIEPIDKSLIIIPNSAITGKNIVNFSKREIRRVDHIFGISYDDNLLLAKETLMEIIKNDPRVLEEPKPLVAVSELADSSVNFTFRAWVKAEEYWDVYFDMVEKVKLTFDDRGITIPYPQMDIHTNTTKENETV